MNEVLTLGIRAVNGGLFVVAFALVGEVAIPKRFAGIFSAAPSVALANLVVVLVSKGSSEAQQQSWGMIVGAVVLILVCAAGVPLLKRWHAFRGSLAICSAWLACAAMGYGLVLR